MRNVVAFFGFVLLYSAVPCQAEFEDLHLLPPLHPGHEGPFKELDAACVDDPIDGPERGKIIVDNIEAVRARVVMIENANCEILIEYFTVASDRISIAGLALLVEAANRGVKVKIILDGITHQITNALAAATLYNPRARQNIEIRVFNPFVLLFPRTWLARLHDKVIVVDGHRIISGGRNISNKYYGVEPGGFYDADVYLEGWLGKTARGYFYDLWNSKLVRPIRLSGYDYDTLDWCRQDAFRFDKPCQRIRQHNIPRMLKYMQALQASTDRLRRARTELEIIAADQRRLTSELQAIDNPTAGQLASFVERDDFLQRRARDLRLGLAVDVTDTQDVITQQDIESREAFVVNDPVTVFYDDPADKKSVEGIATKLRNFFEQRVKNGAEVTVFSPYIVLNDMGQGLMTYLLEEKNATIRFYTNSAVSSDNIYAQAFYRHKDSRDFLLEAGVEIFEFKGYRSREEEERYRSTGLKTTIHFKAALIENPGENPIILLGSYNVDLRSAYYNREFVAVIDAKVSAAQVKIFKDLARMVEQHGYRAGLETHDAAGNMNEWYREYLKTPAWKRAMMKLLRVLNNFTGGWLRKQA